MGLICKSKEIRKLIIERCEEFEISPKHCCEEVGIKWHYFRNNVISLQPLDDDFDINDEKMMKLLDLLGISVKFQIIKRVNGVKEELEANKKYLDNKYNKKDEQGS